MPLTAKLLTRKLLLAAAALAALALAPPFVLHALDDPIAAARAAAAELGYPPDDVVVAAGEYTITMLGRSGSLRFRSKLHPEHGEVFVAVRKPTPFHGWHVTEYRHE